eukprot:8443072-Pyramimonas_sp.AAC.1
MLISRLFSASRIEGLGDAEAWACNDFKELETQWAADAAEVRQRSFTYSGQQLAMGGCELKGKKHVAVDGRIQLFAVR